MYICESNVAAVFDIFVYLPVKLLAINRHVGNCHVPSSITGVQDVGNMVEWLLQRETVLATDIDDVMLISVGCLVERSWARVACDRGVIGIWTKQTRPLLSIRNHIIHARSTSALDFCDSNRNKKTVWLLITYSNTSSDVRRSHSCMEGCSSIKSGISIPWPSLIDESLSCQARFFLLSQWVHRDYANRSPSRFDIFSNVDLAWRAAGLDLAEHAITELAHSASVPFFLLYQDSQHEF